MSIMVDYKNPYIEILYPYRGGNVETKDTFLIEMGNRLSHQRRQMQLTQEELAERSGLSTKTIISAEKGQKALRPENIVRLCQSLDMDIAYFMTGEIPHSNIISSLNHQQRIALDRILDAFLSICRQDKES